MGAAVEPVGPVGQVGSGEPGVPGEPGGAPGEGELLDVPGLSGLTAEGVDELIEQVGGLREEVAEQNTLARANRSWIKFLVVSLALSLVVGGLSVLGAYLLIDRNNNRQQANATAQARALCTDWKGRAESKLLTRSSDAVRSGVRTAADAYRLTRCDVLTGPLGPVDPEAFRPAPPS